MTKISNQYSLTNILTADLANSRLGINNVSPTVALDVTGAGKFSGALTVSGAINLSSSATFPTVGLFNRTSDTTLYMVTATTGFALLDNSQNTMYVATPTSHIWNISNSEKMRITSAGNVGIGTSSPAEPLSVWGSSGIGIYSTNAYASKLTLNFNSSTNIGYLLADQNNFYIRTGVAKAIYVQANEANGVYLSVGATSWTANSDSRLKNIISPINNAIDKLSALNAVIYSWKSDETNKENIGLIAQDVEAVLPQVIDTNQDGFLGVRYTELVPVLVKAIQELSAKVSLLENK